MTIRLIRAVAAFIAGTAALTGCVGPNSSRPDLDRVANHILDLAEATLPEIADSLDATLTKGFLWPEQVGGSEGSTPSLWFRVHGTMVGPEPTSAELEKALIDAGFVLSPPETQPTDDPGARAVTVDGATRISLDYYAPGGSEPGIQFYITNVKELRVSNATVDDFDRTFPRVFDQSLLHEAPDIAALREQANSMLDVAEDIFPALADRLGATLTSARFAVYDDDADAAQASVTFWVDGSMTGPAPTQAALEQALIDEGYTDIVSRSDPNPSDIPYARAISADGTVETRIHYFTLVDPDGRIDFSVSSVVGVRVTDATLADFREVFTRVFDQSLVDSSGN